MTNAQLAAAEQAYLEARDRLDRATVAAARGGIRPNIQTDAQTEAEAAVTAARLALAALEVAPTWPLDDVRAYQTMARWAAQSRAGSWTG